MNEPNHSQKAASAVPTADAVVKLLTELLGRRVTTTKPVKSVRTAPKGVVAVYRIPGGPVKAVAVCDLGFAVQAGAALAMLPAAVAQQEAKAGTLSGGLFDNFREVMNIAASLFNYVNEQRVVFDVMKHEALTALAPDVAKIVRKPGAMLDLGIEINGYGTGFLCLMVE